MSVCGDQGEIMEKTGREWEKLGCHSVVCEGNSTDLSLAYIELVIQII
jgi:hypothetical protein